MTTKALRFGTIILLFAVISSCSREVRESQSEGDRPFDAGYELGCAVDEDGDGYGLGCPQGADCNDSDPKKHAGCGACEVEAEGCECAEGTAPVACYEATLPREDTLVCHNGMRYCRDGAWTRCEGPVSFELNVERQRERALEASRERLSGTSSALLTPQGICSACKPFCNWLEDPLVPGPDALTSSNSKDIEPGPNGGITVTSTPHEQVINNTTTCIPNQCTMASDQTICDDDCDGIPNAYDPAVGKPFGTTATAIFLDLAPGETGDATLNLNYYVRTADVYFLLDAGASMSTMLQRLYTDMQTGTFLSNTSLDCADTDRDGNISTAENALKTQGIAGNIICRLRDGNVGMGWFRDIPFSGVGNYRKVDGLACASGAKAGNTCTVATDVADCGAAGLCTAPTWGTSIAELTFGSTPSRSISNELYYEHRVDMTTDSSLLSTIMNQIRAEGDAETASPNPGAHIMALYAMATGREVYLGWDRPGLPGYRSGVDPAPTNALYTRRPTCGGGTWGYPCFRDSAFPIVVLVTDSTMHNGPPTSPSTAPTDPYAEVKSLIHAGKSWSDGKHHYKLPLAVRDSTTANELTKLPFEGNDRETDAEPVGTLSATSLVTYVGNTRGMTSDLNATQSTCAGLQTASGPDAFYTFSVAQDMQMTVSTRGTRFPVALGIYTNFSQLISGGGLTWTDGTNVNLDDNRYFNVSNEIATIQQPLPAGVNKIITDQVEATQGSLSRDVASVECYAGANDSTKGATCDANQTGSCDYGSDMLFKFNVAQNLDLKIDLSSSSNMSLTLFDAKPQTPKSLEVADGTSSIDLTAKALNAWRFYDANSTSYGPGAYRVVGVDNIDQDANASLSPSDQPLDTLGQTAWIADAPFNNYDDGSSTLKKCESKTSGSPFSGGTSRGWKVDFKLEADPSNPNKLYPIAIEGTGIGKRLAVSDGSGSGNPTSYAIGIVSTGTSTSLSTTYSETAAETCEDQTSVCRLDLSDTAKFPTSDGFMQVNGSFDNATPQPRFTVDVPGTWQDNAAGTNVCSGSSASGYDMVYKLTTGSSAATVDIASKAPVSHLSLHDSSFATAVATSTQESISVTSSNPSLLIYNNVNPASNPAHDSSTVGIGYALDTTAANQNLAVTLDTATDRSITVGLSGTTTISVPPYPSSDLTASGNTGFVDATDSTVTTASATDTNETSGSAPSSDFVASLSSSTAVSATVPAVSAATSNIPLSYHNGTKDDADLSSTSSDLGALDNVAALVSGTIGGTTNDNGNSKGDIDIGQWGTCRGSGGNNRTPDTVIKFTLASQRRVRVTVPATSSGAGASLKVAIFALSSGNYVNQFGTDTCLGPDSSKTVLLNSGTYYLGFTSSSNDTGFVSLGTGVGVTAEDYPLSPSAIDGNAVTFRGNTANARNGADHPRCATGGNRDRVHIFTATNSRPVIISNNLDGNATGSAVAALYEWDTTTQAVSTTNSTALVCLSDGTSGVTTLTAGKTYGLVTYSATVGSGSTDYSVTVDQPPPATDPYVMANTKTGCTTSSAVQNLLGSALCNDSVTFSGATGGASTTGIASGNIPACAATGQADVVHVFSIPGTTGTTPSGLNPAGYDNLITLTNNTVSPGGFTSVAMIYASNSTGTTLSGAALVPLGATSATACTSVASTQTYRLQNNTASAAYYAVVVTRAASATSDGKYNVTLTSGYSDRSGSATDTTGETQTTTAAAVTLNGHRTFSGNTANYRSSDVSFPSGCPVSNTPANGGTSTRGRDVLRPFVLSSRSYVRLKNTSSSGTSIAGIFDSTGTTSQSPLSGSNCVSRSDAGASYDLAAGTYMLAVSDATTGTSGSSYTVDLSTIEIYPSSPAATLTDVSTQGNNHVQFNGSTNGRIADGASRDVWQAFQISNAFDNSLRIYNKGSSSDGFVASINLYTYSNGVLGSIVQQTNGSTGSTAEGSTSTYHLKGSTATSYAVVVSDAGTGSLSSGAYTFEVIASHASEGEEVYSSAAPWSLDLTQETVLNGSTAGRSMDRAITGCTGSNVAQMDVVHRFKVTSDKTVTISNSSSASNIRAYLFDSSGNAVAASGTQCMTTTAGTNSATYGLLASVSYYELVVTSGSPDASGQYELHILPAGLGTSTEFRVVATTEFDPSNTSLNVAKINGDTTGNNADFNRTGWDCAGVASGADRDTYVSFTVPAGFDDVLTLFNQSNGTSYAPAMALYNASNALLSSTAGTTCIAEGNSAGYKIKTGASAQTYYAVISNGGGTSGDVGTFALRLNGASGSASGESGSLSLVGANVDGEYYQVTGDTNLAGATYDLTTLCGAGYNGKQGDLVRSFTVGTTQDITIYNNSLFSGGATVLVMNSGSTTTMPSGWGCIAATNSTTASLPAGTYDLVISNANDNKSSSFDVRIAPAQAEVYSGGTFASSTANNHVRVSGTVYSGTQKDVGTFGCSADTNGDLVHVFNIGTSYDNVVRLKNTSTSSAVAKLYTYNNTTRTIGSAVVPVPSSAGDICVNGDSTNENTTYRISSAVSATGYYAVVVKGTAGSAYSFELIADASEETSAETYSGLASASLVGSYVELNGSTANRSADYSTLPGGCTYGTPNAKQSDVRHIFRLNADAVVTLEDVNNTSAVSTVAALYSCTDSTCGTMTLVGGCVTEGSAATSYGTLSGASAGTYYAVVVSTANGENSAAAYGGYDGAYTIRIKAVSTTAVETYTLASNLNTATSGRDVILSGTTAGASSGALTARAFDGGGNGTQGACIQGAAGSNNDGVNTQPDVLHTFVLGTAATLRVKLTKGTGTNFSPLAALFSGTTIDETNLKTASSGGYSCSGAADVNGVTNAAVAILPGTDAVYNNLAAGTYTIAVTNSWLSTQSGATGTYTLELIAPDQESQGGAVACSNASTPKITNVTLAANSTYYVVAKAPGVGAINTGAFSIDVTRSTGSSSSSSTALVDCASCDGNGFGGGCIYDGGIGAQWTRLETSLAAGNYTAYIRPLDGSNRLQPKILIRDLGYLPKPYDQDESNSTYVPACQQESNGNAGIQKVFSDPNDPRVFTLGNLPQYDSNGTLIDYYLLLRGFSNAVAPLDFSITLNDPNTTNIDANVSYCAGQSSDAELTQTFRAGTVYKAIVKGIGPNDAGNYNLTFGKLYDSNNTGVGVQESLDVNESTPLVSYNGVNPNGTSLLPDVADELATRGIKVIGINTASGASSALVTAQLTTLAKETDTYGIAGALVTTASDSNISSVVVQSVEDLSLSSTSDVTVKLVKYPDNPNGDMDDFEFYVSAVEQPGTTDPTADGCPTRSDSTPNAALDAAYGPDTHDDCKAGALPRFVVTFKNPPAPNNVPCKCTVMPTHPDCKLKLAGGTWDGVSCVGWNLTLQLVANGKYVVEQIPVYIVTQDLMRPPDYDEFVSTGSYWQDFAADQCRAGETPDWAELEWSSSIPTAAGAQLAWDVCTGNTLTDVGNCTDSNYTRVATVRRYTMAATEADCLAANGYWERSISTPQCQIIQGAACSTSASCGGGVCSGGFCYWTKLPLDLGAMLPAGKNGSNAVRVKAVLNASTDARSAPEVYRWAARYYCSGTE